MSKRIFAVSMLAGVLALACTESVGPTSDLPTVAVQEQMPHHLRWNSANGPAQFSAVAGEAGGGVELAPQTQYTASFSSAAELGAYKTGFWAVQDEDRFIQINYKDPATGAKRPYLRLDVEEIAYVPGVGKLERGDSVFITVAVDPEDMRVEFGPSGLVFDDEAELTMWYTGANGDLNNDGVVDKMDYYIEQNLLGVWLQQGDEPWAPLKSKVLVENKAVYSLLEHFSGYSISW